MKGRILLCLLICLPLVFKAQVSILDDFRAEENEGEVVLTWIISSGSTCNGIDIMHSTDSLNFSVIGDIEGICGDEDKAVSYTYVHQNPQLNTVNHYRLELGGIGSSTIVSITILDIEKKGYVLYPNPLVDQSVIYFRNTRASRAELELYSIGGTLVRREMGSGNQFAIHKNELQSGLYIFTISFAGNNELITGKLLVQN